MILALTTRSSWSRIVAVAVPELNRIRVVPVLVRVTVAELVRCLAR